MNGNSIIINSVAFESLQLKNKPNHLIINLLGCNPNLVTMI